MRNYISAIDYKTGKTVWKHVYPNLGRRRPGSGMLTTAGKLLFAGDVSGNIVALRRGKGKPLWHVYLGTRYRTRRKLSLLDGHQYVLTAAGDTLYAFTLY